MRRAALSGPVRPGRGGDDGVTAFAGMRRVAACCSRPPAPTAGPLRAQAASALRLAIGATSRTTFYSFTCPECGSAVRKPAGERIVELLTGGGVRTLRLHSTTSRLDLMFWPMFAIVLGFLGIAVLGVLAVRVFVEAQRLGKQVADSARRINQAAEDLERAAVEVARSVDAV